jgi:murein DD-endopeptidase MepM/ murein hydrolase activator NlpD
VVAAFIPATARAGILADFIERLRNSASAKETTAQANLQNIPLPQPALNINPSSARGGGDVQIVDDTALIPAEGPSGTIADIEKPKNGTISKYIVRPGDTVSSIAKMFGVTSGTVLASNDIPKSGVLTVGQTLVILPVPGIPYTVKSGDTLASVAKRYGGDPDEIASFNEIPDGVLAVGTSIIIPNGEVPAPTPSASQGQPTRSTPAPTRSRGVVGPSSIFANNPKEPAHNICEIGTLAQVSYYIAPVAHYVRTQGIHGYNGVDFGAPIGTPIVASAEGDVVIAKDGGWNGGYGSYVVIQHDNGSQTLYGHMSVVDVYDGEHVQQGQVIGAIGSTGKSTGAHLHFEIRNGIRNPF